VGERLQQDQFQQQGGQFQQPMAQAGGYAASQDPMAPPVPSQGQVPAPGQQMTEDYSQAPQEYQEPEGEQYYDDQSYQAQPQGAFDLNTINDIAEQVVLEKTKKMNTQLNSLKEFKSLIEAQVDRLERSTKHIEKIINNLQSSIIQKIGDYGEGIGEIKSEMSMMQDSFGKVLPELAEKRHVVHATKKHVVKKPVKKKVHKRSVKKKARKKVKKRK
jgi:chaperonin cofactor prefoldin